MPRMVSRPEAPAPARGRGRGREEGFVDAREEDNFRDTGGGRRVATRTARRAAPAEEPARSGARGRSTPRARTVEEDEQPRGRGRAAEPDDGDDPVVEGGWGELHRVKSLSSSFAEEFKPEKGITYLLKFMDDDPFAVYGEHWLDNAPSKKSWLCPATLRGQDLPCAIHDVLGDSKTRARALFNVILFEESQSGRQKTYTPVLKVWYLTPQPANEIEGLSQDEMTRPLTKDYVKFSWRQTGSKKNQVTYSATKVKERDLLDDWGIDPLSDAELDEFDAECYDETVVRVPTTEELEELVEAMIEGESGSSRRTNRSRR
jgi:hypothetical protein